MKFEDVIAMIREYPDFPKKGILFRDVLPIFRDPKAVEVLIDHLSEKLSEINAKNGGSKIDVVVGAEARGFILGALLAQRIGAAFVPVRKSGKLPGKVSSVVYEKEYGPDTMEVQYGSIQANQNVVAIDDLLATGGTAGAVERLVMEQGAKIIANLFIVELVDLEGAKKLTAQVYSAYKC
ncbi:adenine phosphoribosyltransferase [Mycoemilia scoparia]|uniref:adenine phosphoribosyltransferase n=1 Tax=Mycoemilia scoparia TaxID=417184 RepID=A0A9W8DXA9_9FUNG|nr:adenine phosphoribosyltransferase [Mycoemilia scoparia]